MRKLRNRKQYWINFSWVGVDIDMFAFKGVMLLMLMACTLDKGFHLDSRINSKAFDDKEHTLCQQPLQMVKKAISLMLLAQMQEQKLT